MPDSRLRAASYAAGLGSLMATPILAVILWKGWRVVAAEQPNWWALLALISYVALVVILTYLQRRGVNLGRGLI